ncbi:hypothetical protein DFH09DRAFT_1069641 [Mycena vulgaris]|nr:hypothetical protein DFH09DRAFT_1069641 [Mycena vulgaris]
MLENSPEIVLEILDMLSIPVSFHTDNPPNQATLASCSLVYKSWSTHSQQLLFQRVSIDSEWEGSIAAAMYRPRPVTTMAPPVDRLVSFLRTITEDTKKSRWLRDTVLSIILQPHSGAKSRDIINILLNFPNLPELSATGRACTFNDEELSQLQHLGPHIRSLHVNANHTGPKMGPAAWPYIRGAQSKSAPDAFALFTPDAFRHVTQKSLAPHFSFVHRDDPLNYNKRGW